MSESDSDQEFESADEDNELDFISSKLSDLNKREVEIKPEGGEVNQTHGKTKHLFTKDVDEAVNALPKTGSSAVDSEKIENINKNPEMEDSNTTSKIDIIAKDPDNTTEKTILTACKDTRLQEPIKEDLAPISNSEIFFKELNTDKTGNSETKNTVKEAEKPQRIPLRREKKMQLKQKLQAKPEEMESYVRKEIIASDVTETASAAREEEKPAKQSSTWGFGTWGSSLLSTAVSSVSTFSNQVSQGLGSVLETVESTIGAPSPEELVSQLSRTDGNGEPITKAEDAKSDAGSSLLPDVSAWTKVFEDTSSKVMMGGLNTLEMIGKKTMDILTENDPGLRKTRAAFSEKINLSEMLREAKARADEQDQDTEDDDEVVHYSQVFDEQQGLVHLEALEMLSKQSQAKTHRLLMRHSKQSELKRKLEEIRSICENLPIVDDLSDCENFEDFDSVLKKHILELSLPLNIDNVIKVQRKINDYIKQHETVTEEDPITSKEIYRSAISHLAEFTARCIETFHKAAELILVQPNLDPENCASNLTGVTTVMCIEINNLSSSYQKCLDSVADKSLDESSRNVTALVTNLYVEASNSNNYIQDAFLMLVPILQTCTLEITN